MKVSQNMFLDMMLKSEAGWSPKNATHPRFRPS